MNSFFSDEELITIGFKKIGKDALVSRKCSIYGAHNISIGDNVRIDDFVILSGNITFGSHIHISAYSAIYGGLYGVELMDYTGMSPRSTIYSSMDDFGGDYLVGPIHDINFTNVTGGKVVIEQFSHIGANSIIFPAVTLSEGTVVGASSLIKNQTDPWHIYAGVPAVKIKKRSEKMKYYVSK